MQPYVPTLQPYVPTMQPYVSTLQLYVPRPGQLYVGHSMNLMREACFTAVYLGLYARLRQAAQPDSIIDRQADRQ